MPTRRIPAALAGASLALLALGACVPQSAPPAPLPAPVPAPVPLPPPPPPRAIDWETGPLSPGEWRYQLEDGMPMAWFGGFSILCGRDRNVHISGPQGTAFIVRTSFGQRRIPSSPNHFMSVAMLPATDPLLDQMAFSRGRFLVAAEGGGSLVVPAWPEFARVIEECRGQ